MSHRLQVLVPEQIAAAIRKAAQRRKVSSGEWVRRAIERSLAEDQPAKDALARLSALEAPTADIGQMLAEIESGRS